MNMNTAQKTLKTLGFKKTSVCSFEHLEMDNSELHEVLNDECSMFQEIMGQDTWSFTDGSYITRNGDDYYDGNDVSDFLLTEAMYDN